jgi:hypothetical protein
MLALTNTTIEKHHENIATNEFIFGCPCPAAFEHVKDLPVPANEDVQISAMLNPRIYRLRKYHLDIVRKRCAVFRDELMARVWNPANSAKFVGLGY